MKTIREMLDSGSKEQIERMLKAWRKLYGKGMKEKCRKSSISTIRSVLTDAEIISALNGHPDLLWSRKKFLSWRKPHRRIIGITESLVMGWQNGNWVGDILDSKEYEFQEDSGVGCLSFFSKSTSEDPT